MIFILIFNLDLVGTKCFYRHSNCKTPFSFIVENDASILVYFIQSDHSRDCNTRLIVAASIGTLIGILLILILIILIVIKFILYMIDKNEYKKFCEERNQANWETVIFVYFK